MGDLNKNRLLGIDSNDRLKLIKFPTANGNTYSVNTHSKKSG
jgi:hypothetical protein